MRSLAARPGWEEQMFPNWHSCCPGVSSSDSVPLPPLALTGGSLPLDLKPQRMEQGWLFLCQCPAWSCCSPARGGPGEGSRCHCWPTPRVTRGQSGLPWPLTRREIKYSHFSIYPSHLTRAATAQVRTPTTTECIPWALRVFEGVLGLS